MPIRNMLDQAGFGPHEVGEITAAFEATLAALNLVHRPDAITTLSHAPSLSAPRPGRSSVSGCVTAQSTPSAHGEEVSELGYRSRAACGHIRLTSHT